MMNEIQYRRIEFGSPEQIESIKLRDMVLRKPLGLRFDTNDLDAEFDQIHIAAIFHNEILGILLLDPVNDTLQLKMRQVAVNPLYQNMGIGKEMVKFAEALALQLVYTEIVLHARETAVKFYLDLQYEVLGEGFIEVGIPHFKMHKYLNQV